MKKVKLFYGDYESVKEALSTIAYYEFELQYEQYEKEINRFLWESRKEMTEYKNRYTGNVVIDLSKWNERCDKPFFEAFQYFLLDNVTEIIFILDNKPSNKLLNSLSKKFDIETKELSLTKKAIKQKRIGFIYEEEKENVRS